MCCVRSNPEPHIAFVVNGWLKLHDCQIGRVEKNCIYLASPELGLPVNLTRMKYPDSYQCIQERMASVIEFPIRRLSRTTRNDKSCPVDPSQPSSGAASQDLRRPVRGRQDGPIDLACCRERRLEIKTVPSGGGDDGSMYLLFRWSFLDAIEGSGKLCQMLEYFLVINLCLTTGTHRGP